MDSDRTFGPYGLNEVHCVDCLEAMRELPDGCVDAVVTDPPYGINGATGGQSEADARIYSGAFPDTPVYVRKVVVPAIVEARRVARVVVATVGDRNLMLYPQPDAIGAMWTPAASRLGRWGFTSYQPILYYGRDPRGGRGPWPSGRQVTERAGKNGHPCPKPLGFMRWLVEKASISREDIILDPFAGSGTTLVAAKQLGRRYLGFEIEPRYVEIAQRRLEQETLELAGEGDDA